MSADSISQWLKLVSPSDCEQDHEGINFQQHLHQPAVIVPQEGDDGDLASMHAYHQKQHQHEQPIFKMDQSKGGGFHGKICDTEAFDEWREQARLSKSSHSRTTSSSSTTTCADLSRCMSSDGETDHVDIAIDTNNNNSAHCQQYYSNETQICIMKGKRRDVRDGDDLCFDALPREIRIRILSFLNSRDIWRLSAVSRSWYDITNDRILWRFILERELPLWHTVTSDTLPGHHAMFKMPKQTYRNCSPMLGEHSRALASLRPSFVSLFTRKKRIRLAIFGAGLEHIAHSLIEDMLWGSDTPFTVEGMLPGVGGVGGGVTLQLGGHLVIDVITLYQKTASERRAGNDEQSGNLQGTSGQLSESARRVCESVNGFVFVVDAGLLSTSSPSSSLIQHDDYDIYNSAALTTGNLIGSRVHCPSSNLSSPQQETEQPMDTHALHQKRCLSELLQFMDSRWTSTAAPLLVWNCSSSATTRKSPAIATTDLLMLAGQKRSWRVDDVCVENFAGPVTKSISWLSSKLQH